MSTARSEKYENQADMNTDQGATNARELAAIFR